MKLSLKWLREYVAVKLTPKQVADRLTMAGLEVKDRRVVDDDTVFECEVTPNRPDWLSHVGVARELAALTGGALKLPRAEWPKPAGGRKPDIRITDRKACRRYVGTLIEGVTVGPSPAWLRERLAAMSVRPINNVVDITNVVLFELGQPLHAFDADRLSKGRIVVRRAAAGESLMTIDGVTRALDPSILVIADAQRPVAAAGIMGGQSTEVSASTTRVLLESAWFDPLVTRRASRRLGLASDSSYRFERGVDLEQVAAAARRAAALIVEIAGGRIVGGPVDRRTARPKGRPVAWTPSAASALGVAIPALKQRQLLERLGCRVTGVGERWKVLPPTWRADLKQPADLLEELARLWGYERIPVTLPVPHPRLDAVGREDLLRRQEQRIREHLVACGLDEIMTYSLVSPDAIQNVAWGSGNPVVLENSLSADHSVLRPTMAIGALDSVARNLNRKIPGVALFELGRTYGWTSDGQGQPDERRSLSVALAGLQPSSWGAKPAGWTIFHAKGILNDLARRLGAAIAWQIPQDPFPLFDRGATLCAFAPPGHRVGAQLGEVDLAVRSAFDIPATVTMVLAEIEWPLWWGTPAPPANFKPLARVAPVTRDFSILVDEQVTQAELVEMVRAAWGRLVSGIHPFDLYRGGQVPAGRKSVAYTVVYSDGDRTLTDAEVSATHTAILHALQAPPIGATLR